MTYVIKPGAVIHGDCLTVLRQMEAGSVDTVITDPPYGVNYQSTRAAELQHLRRTGQMPQAPRIGEQVRINRPLWEARP